MYLNKFSIYVYVYISDYLYNINRYILIYYKTNTVSFLTNLLTVSLVNYYSSLKSILLPTNTFKLSGFSFSTSGYHYINSYIESSIFLILFHKHFKMMLDVPQKIQSKIHVLMHNLIIWVFEILLNQLYPYIYLYYTQILFCYHKLRLIYSFPTFTEVVKLSNTVGI